jgi:hypothetical protein
VNEGASVSEPFEGNVIDHTQPEGAYVDYSKQMGMITHRLTEMNERASVDHSKQKG